MKGGNTLVKSKIKLLLFLLLIFGNIVIIAPNSPVYCSELMKTTPEINLVEGYIIVEGVGVAPNNIYNDAQAKALARLAAKVDAQRNLLEIIAGLQLDSETSVVNLLANDKVRTKVEGILQGGQILPESEQYQEGFFRLKIRVEIKDITPLVYPTPETASEIALPQSMEEKSYTGLIINAQELNVSLSENLEIRDISGNLIYSAKRAFYQPTNSIFQTNMDQALADSRIGTNPLIISAVQTKEHDNSTILVSNEDGRLILTVLHDTDVFLLSKIVIITGGSENES